MDSLGFIFFSVVSALFWLAALLDYRSWPVVRLLAVVAIIVLAVYIGGVLAATHSMFGWNDIRLGEVTALFLIGGFLVAMGGISKRAAPPPSANRGVR